jgi:hypothetical protein
MSRKQSRHLGLQLNDKDFRGMVWDQSHTNCCTTDFSMNNWNLSEIRCDCTHLDRSSWCTHAVASVMTLVKSPEKVKFIQNVKSKLAEMNKDDLITLILNQASVSADFHNLVENTPKEGIHDVSIDSDSNLINEPVINVQVMLKELVEAYQRTKIIWDTKKEIDYREPIKQCQILLETVHALWKKRYYASCLGLFDAVTECVVSNRRCVGEVTLNYDHQMMIQDMSCRWLRYVTDDMVVTSLKEKLKGKFEGWGRKMALDLLMTKFFACESLATSDWKEPWLVELMEGSDSVDCLEGSRTLAERANILKSKGKEYTPIINYILKTLSIMIRAMENYGIDLPSNLAKMLETLSLPHSIIFQLYDECEKFHRTGEGIERRLINWPMIVNQAFKLRNMAIKERNTTQVQTLLNLAIDQHIETILQPCRGQGPYAMILAVKEEFCKIPDALQGLYCYYFFWEIFYVHSHDITVNKDVLKLVLSRLEAEGDYFELTRFLCRFPSDITPVIKIDQILSNAFTLGCNVIPNLFSKCQSVSETVLLRFAELCERHDHLVQLLNFFAKFASCLQVGTESSKKFYQVIDKLDKGVVIAALRDATFECKYAIHLVNTKLLDVPEFQRNLSIPILLRLLHTFATNWTSINTFHDPKTLASLSSVSLVILKAQILREMPEFGETIPLLIWNLKKLCGENSEMELVKLCESFVLGETFAIFALIAMGTGWIQTARNLAMKATAMSGNLDKTEFYAKVSSILTDQEKLTMMSSVAKQNPTLANYTTLVELDASWKDRIEEMVEEKTTICIPLLMHFRKYNLIREKLLKKEFASPLLQVLITILKESMKSQMSDKVTLETLHDIIKYCIARDFATTLPPTSWPRKSVSNTNRYRMRHLLEDYGATLETSGYPPGLIPNSIDVQCPFFDLVREFVSKGMVETAFRNAVARMNTRSIPCRNPSTFWCRAK